MTKHMTKLTTEELVKVVDAMEEHNMVGHTTMWVSGAKNNTEHANVLTMHTEEEGYTHLLTMHTMTREVLAHELAHMHMHKMGRYKEAEPHNEEHTSTTEAMLKIMTTLL